MDFFGKFYGYWWVWISKLQVPIYLAHWVLNCEQFFFFNACSKRFLKLWFISHKSPLPIIFGVRKQLSHIRFKELQVQESRRLTFQRGFKKQLLMHARRGIYHKTCTHVYVPCLLAAAVCKSIRTHYLHMYTYMYWFVGHIIVPSVYLHICKYRLRSFIHFIPNITSMK